MFGSMRKSLSIPSAREEIIDTLSDLPLKEIVDAVLSALDGINQVVRIPEIRQLFQSALKSLDRIDGLVNILAHPSVATIFLIPGVRETLRVNGHATIHDEPTTVSVRRAA